MATLSRPGPDPTAGSAPPADPGFRRQAGVEYTPIVGEDGPSPSSPRPHRGERVFLKAGDVLFEPGDLLPGAYFILRGRVELVIEGPGEREMVLVSIGPGAFVGEDFVLGRAPSLLWAVAATDVEAVLYDRSGLLEQTVASPRLLEALLLTLSKKLETVTIRLHNVTFMPLECRIAKSLLAGSHRDERLGLITRATHSEIARCTGSCRVAVSKSLRRMEGAGLVRRHRGFVRLLDTSRLIPMACNVGQPDPGPADAGHRNPN